MKTTLTPSQLAKRWGCGVDTVLRLIARGQLKAFNVAVQPNGKKPRWRMHEEDVVAFEVARSTAPRASASKPARKPRASQDEFQYV